MENEVQNVFDDLKSRINAISAPELQALSVNAHALLDKYCRTGQEKAARKLLFVMQSLDKEKALIDMGINRFIYKDDIDFYIDNCTNETNPVKIIELRNYVRDVPEEAAEIVEKTQSIFDEFFVVYTDYASNDDRRVEAENRRKDPILFGTFLSEKNRVCIDRFYFLADWVDEFCDLTLDKMLEALTRNGRTEAQKSIERLPRSMDELTNLVNSYKDGDGNVEFSIASGSYSVSYNKKSSFFSRIHSLFSRK